MTDAMLCPHDHRPCAAPRCAVCPISPEIEARIAEFGPDTGFTHAELIAGLTTRATEDKETP